MARRVAFQHRPIASEWAWRRRWRRRWASERVSQVPLEAVERKIGRAAAAWRKWPAIEQHELASAHQTESREEHLGVRSLRHPPWLTIKIPPSPSAQLKQNNRPRARSPGWPRRRGAHALFQQNQVIRPNLRLPKGGSALMLIPVVLFLFLLNFTDFNEEKVRFGVEMWNWLCKKK